MATLAAVATLTERIRLGPLVTSPTFRHPVPLAKELMTLDDLSEGRLSIGLGAGGEGADTTVLGQPLRRPAERMERFEEFVQMLDELLVQETTTWRGKHYTAEDARMIPGCVQTPRPPLYLAATGPRGLRTVARHGSVWVTTGDPRMAAGTPSDARIGAVRRQRDCLIEACERERRDPAEIDICLVHGTRSEPPFRSVEAFVDYAGRCRDIGVTEIVLHWPIAGSEFTEDPEVFEQIAQEGRRHLS